MSKWDILNLEWASSGRDIHIVEPILCYLEKFHGYKVKRESYLFALSKIFFLRPKMLLLSNNTGSIRNYYASKMAYMLGIKVVTLSSEGDYCIVGDASLTGSFFWGWDLEKRFPVDLHLEWSQKNVDLIRKYVENSDSILKRTKISGGTGFDRYIICEFKNKEEFLTDYEKKRFTKIIGYAAWGFDLYYDKEFCASATFNPSEEYMSFHKNNRILLNELLKKIIKSNKEILFVLKRHPGELEYENTELAGLEVYDNVLIIKDEEKIEDLINVCDFWMAYESTTCLEAWLLGKQTVLINPMKFTEKRSDISLGSPIRSTYAELQKDIDMGEIIGFIDFKNKRDELIKKIIEYADGKNHIRAAQYIIEEFEKETIREKEFDFWIIKHWFKELIKMGIWFSGLRKMPFLAEKVKEYEDYVRLYSNKERTDYIKKYSEAISKFDKL